MPDPDHFFPETLDEVAALLLAADGPARLAVRGTTLLAQASGTSGLTPVVVDVARVPELNRVEYDERNGLLIGAAVSLADALRFAPVQHAYPILADDVCLPGSDDVRARTTFGECLADRAARADLAPPLICLGASIAIFGPHGWSEMSVEALCARGHRTALLPGEFIVNVRFPAPTARSGGAYVRSASRDAARFVVGVGALLVMEDDLETCCGARLAVRVEAARPNRVPDAERFLRGRRLDDTTVEEAGGLAAEYAGSAGPSRSLTALPAVLKATACQAIRRALERARPRPDATRRVRRT
jgi:carbon-monoxide dehydrogenase medium subunit